MIDSPAEFSGQEELYAPCVKDAWVLAHLGQSLDGRIATRSGASHYINGPDNLTHLHRLRALADAVVVGAATVALDDPRLTVRRVEGANPVRVVLDPGRRLPVERHVFTEADAPTLLFSREASGGHGLAEVVAAPAEGSGLCLDSVLAELNRRRLHRVLIEGGGATVSGFLRARALDRLQICVAPLIIGSGRPGITLPEIETLKEALRPRSRVFSMGNDVLFDLDLRGDG